MKSTLQEVEATAEGQTTQKVSPVKKEVEDEAADDVKEEDLKANETPRNKRVAQESQEMNAVMSPPKKQATDDDNQNTGEIVLAAIASTDNNGEYDPNKDPVIQAARERRRQMEENLEKTKKMMEDMKNGILSLTSNIESVKDSFHTLHERADYVLQQSNAHREGLKEMKEKMIQINKQQAEQDAKFKAECAALKDKIMGIVEQEKQSLAKIKALNEEHKEMLELTAAVSEEVADAIES